MIINELLNYLKSKLRGKEIGRVCFTVPYEFYKNKREDLLTCCQIVGLKRENIEIIHSIQSALIEYNSRKHLKKNDKIVLIDFNQESFGCYCCEIIGDDINDIHNFARVLSYDYDTTIGGLKYTVIIGELLFEKINDACQLDGKGRPYKFYEFLSIKQNLGKDDISDIDERNDKVDEIYYFWKQVEKSKTEIWNEEQVKVSPQMFIENSNVKTLENSFIKYEDVEKICIKEGIDRRMAKIIKETIKLAKFDIHEITYCLLIGEERNAKFVKRRISEIISNVIIYPPLENKIDQGKLVTAEVEIATKRAYQMRNEINLKNPILQCIYFISFDNSDPQILFIKGKKLPVTRIITVRLKQTMKQPLNVQIGEMNEHSTSKKIIIQNTIDNINETNVFKVQIFIDKFGFIQLWYVNEINKKINNKVFTIGNIFLTEKKTTTSIKRLEDYISRVETDSVKKIYPEKDNQRQIDLRKKSCSIQLRDNYSIPYYFDENNGTFEQLTQPNEFVDTTISVSKKGNRAEFTWKKKSETYPKITDISNVISNPQLMKMIGITTEKEKSEKRITFGKVDATSTMKDMISTYMSEIVKIFESKINQNIGNVIITIPLHMNEGCIDFISKYLKIRGINNIEFMYESYAALMCFNTFKSLKITYIGIDTTVRIINILENHIEVDVIKIEEMIGDIITKTKRLVKHISEDDYEINLQKIVYNLIVNHLKKSFNKIYQKCILIEEFDNENIKINKRENIELIQKECEQIVKQLYENKKQSASFLLKDLKMIDSIDEGKSIQIDHNSIENERINIENEITNKINATVQKFVYEDKIKTDYVIIVGNVCLQSVYEYLQNNCFGDITVYRFGRDDIGRGACKRAYEIQDLFGSDVIIEKDIKICIE